MTKQIEVQIPAGFHPVSFEPTGRADKRYDVVYAPHDKQTHFEIGTARFSPTSNPLYRWKTVDGDNVGDSGRAVLAWREQSDDMKIVRIERPAPVAVAATDKVGYDRAIALLGARNLELSLDGAQDDRPQGWGLVAELFGVPSDQVKRDYQKVAEELNQARLLKMRRHG